MSAPAQLAGALRLASPARAAWRKRRAPSKRTPFASFQLNRPGDTFSRADWAPLTERSSGDQVACLRAARACAQHSHDITWPAGMADGSVN